MKSTNNKTEWLNEDVVKMYFLNTKNNVLFWIIYFFIDYSSSLIIAPDDVQIHAALFNFAFVLIFFYGTLFLLSVEVLPVKYRYLIGLKHLLFILFIIYSKWILSLILFNSNVIFNQFLLIEFIRCLHFSLLAALVCFILISYKRLQEKHKIQLEAKHIELTHYHLIIKPHFIANGLNAIHSDLITGSKRFEQNLAEFTEIIAYCYSNGNNKKILLSNEIICIQKFISFQRLRFGKNLKLIFLDKVDTSLLTKTKIPKMILLTLVENVFKHGDISSSIHPATICISLSLVNELKTFYLSISNKIKTDSQPLKNSNSGHRAIKYLLNTYFPNQHFLDIYELNNIFNLKLTINYDKEI